MINVLYYLGLLGAAAAVVIYFVQIARFRKWVRLVSGAGLFFTGVGLAEAVVAMRAVGSDMDRAMPSAVCVAALLAAVYLQGVAALRRRSHAAEAVSAAQPSEAV